jgi:predicted nucleic acid-binding protein
VVSGIGKRNEFVTDTNVLINFLGGQKKMFDALNGKDIAISFITEMELLAWPSITSKDILIIKAMLTQYRIVPMEDAIKQEAILIRRRTKMKLPDAIIAATAIILRKPLITTDSGFNRVDELVDVVLI